MELKESAENIYWQMNEKYNIREKLSNLGRNIALQGEIIGDGIQGNKYKLGKNERRLYLFNMYDIDKAEYLGYEEFISLANEFGIETVPFIDIDFELIDDIDALVELSKGVSALNKNTKREGIVIKSYEEINDMGERVSFKAINPDFLIKYGE